MFVFGTTGIQHLPYCVNTNCDSNNAGEARTMREAGENAPGCGWAAGLAMLKRRDKETFGGSVVLIRMERPWEEN